MDLSEVQGHSNQSGSSWERARYKIIINRVQSVAYLNHRLKILDLGSGDSWLSHQLVHYFPVDVHCVDSHYTSEAIAGIKQRFSEVKQKGKIHFGSTIPDEKFDIILALDIIEHVENDDHLLQNLYNLVNEGSLLIVTVPLWPKFFKGHDVKLGHLRRYTEEVIDHKITQAGFKKKKSHQFFLLPFILRWAQHKNFIEFSPDPCSQSPVIYFLLRVETILMDLLLKLRVGYLGLSWLGVFEKRKGC